MIFSKLFTTKPTLAPAEIYCLFALYKIFEDAKYQYPKYDKARAMETRKSLEFNWINNIADGIEENTQGNTLILMTSYDNVYTMKEKLDNIATNKEAYIHDYKIIAASENESLEITKDKYIKAKVLRADDEEHKFIIEWEGKIYKIAQLAFQRDQANFQREQERLQSKLQTDISSQKEILTTLVNQIHSAKQEMKIEESKEYDFFPSTVGNSFRSRQRLRFAGVHTSYEKHATQLFKKSFPLG